jgi:two-component system, NarL family, nitrate/nitrite response regulator NarL
MNEKTRIVIADDHTIFRRGLIPLLAGEPELQVVGEASDGEQVLQMIQNLHPDILLLDLAMPKVSGMEVLQALAISECKVRVVVLTGTADGEQIARIFKLGARGVVLKESATTVLVKCIQAVKAGEYWVGRKVAAKPRSSPKSYNKISAKDQKDYGLTQREIEIIQAVALGAPNKEIANLLGISEQTVKHHITNIFDKVGVYNRLELTLFAFHHGLVENGN